MNELTKANGGTIVRQEFGATELAPIVETAATAVAARSQAAIQARYIMAMKYPRDVEVFRAALLKECKRPGFAEIAEYARPVGREKNKATGEWEDKIARGPSIHLIRTALRLFSNNSSDASTTFDSDDSRITKVELVDYETNVAISRDINLQKVVEKRGKKSKDAWQPPEGRDVVGERVNSYGDPVYLCRATVDEVRTSEARMVALFKRAIGEEILPRDIIQEALRACAATVEAQDAQDPDAAKRRVIDLFTDVGITAAQLGEYLGRSLDQPFTAAELADLRRVYTTLKEGDATWQEVMLARDPVSGSREAQEDAAQRKIASLRGETKQTQPETEQKKLETFITHAQISELFEAAQQAGWSSVDLGKLFIKAGIPDETKIPASRFKEVMEAINAGGQPKKGRTP